MSDVGKADLAVRIVQSVAQADQSVFVVNQKVVAGTPVAGDAPVVQADGSLAWALILAKAAADASYAALTDPRLNPLAPHDALTRPWDFDMFWDFFLGRGFMSNGQTVATTLSLSAAIGAISVTPVSTTSFQVGQVIMIGDPFAFDVVLITANNGTTLTFGPKLVNAYSAGASVTPAWNNDYHPALSRAYQGLAQWIANYKQRHACTGPNLFPWDMSGTWAADTNGVTMPPGWQTIAATGNPTAVKPTYSTASTNPNARNTGLQITVSAVGQGVKLAAGHAVTAGDTIKVSMQVALTSGSSFSFKVVDNANNATVLATSDNIGNTRNNGIIAVRTSAPPFVVPAGVTAIDIQLIAVSSGNQWSMGDPRIERVRQSTATDRYVLEDPGYQPIVCLGDSWFAPSAPNDLSSYIGAALANRLAKTARYLIGVGGPTVAGQALPVPDPTYVTVVNSGVSGQNLAQMVARMATDVVAYNPRYCILADGANDLSQGVALATWQGQLDTWVQTCRAAGIIPVYLGVGAFDLVMQNSHDWNDAARTQLMAYTV